MPTKKNWGTKKEKWAGLQPLINIIQQVLNAKVHKDIENSPLKNQQPAERLTACNRASQLLLVANLAKQLIHKIAHGNPVWVTNSDHYTTEQDRGKTGERITASLRIISCIHSYSTMYFKSLLPDIIEDLIEKKEGLKPKEIIKALEDEIEGFREILTDQHTSNSINQIILNAVSNPQESSIHDGVELTCFKIK